VILLAAYFSAGVVFAVGCMLIAGEIRSGYRMRGRPDLAERLLPYRPHVADEVELWLRRQTR
jgi:hypothetical protein